MRKVLVAALVCCLAVTTGADDAKPAAEVKPLIFINTNSVIGFWTAINGGLAPFADLAREAGFSVNHGYRTAITDANMAGISVYILPAPGPPGFMLQDDDKTALRRFIRSGGTFLLMPVSIPIGNFGGFLDEYGITFRDWEASTHKVIFPANSPLKGPEKLNTVTNLGRRNITVTDETVAVPIAYLDDGRLLGVEVRHRNVGKGRIIFFGGLAMFGTTAGATIDLDDNRKFVKNFIKYLKGRFDLNITFAKPKGRNLTTGDKVTLIANVKNVGNVSSEKTILRFILSSGKDYPIKDGGFAIQMKTVTVSRLQPDQLKKFSFRVKIPAFMVAGSYFLIVVIDPDGTTSDKNPGNNIKVSKKKMVLN